jgi:TNF receptor-associated protein 1
MSAEDIMPPQTLEVNPSHPLIVGLNLLREQEFSAGGGGDDNQTNSKAKLILEQLVDNAMITAGLIDDSRGVVSRVNKLMLELIKASTNSPQK